MFSFLVTLSTSTGHPVMAVIKPEDAYDWFTYTGPTLKVPYRSSVVEVSKGTRFGVRQSSNGKHIRLVLAPDVNRVMTIDLKLAKKLSEHIKPGRSK